MAIAQAHLDPYEFTFGDRIRKARRIAGLTQQEVAEQLGIKVGRYSAWEIDESRPRDVVAVARSIADMTDAPVDWLLGLRTGSYSSPSLHLLTNDDPIEDQLEALHAARFGYAGVNDEFLN